MELTLAESTKLSLKTVKTRPKRMTAKMGYIFMGLEESKPVSFPSLKLFSRLNSSLLQNSHPLPSKSCIDFRLHIAILYGPTISENSSQTDNNATLMIKDADDENGLLKRLGSICGGIKNITANLELKIQYKSVEETLIFKDLESVSEANYQRNFTLPLTLAQKWKPKFVFGGTLSLTLKLNAEAANRIYGGTRNLFEPAYRKILNNAAINANIYIVAENGAEVPCHKVFFTVHNNTFRDLVAEMEDGQDNKLEMPFISEAGARALLSFLYCHDITDAIISSEIAVELLMAADKYKLKTLLKVMNGLVLDMSINSFTVASADKLLALVGGKNNPDLKEIEDKAKAILEAHEVPTAPNPID